MPSQILVPVVLFAAGLVVAFLKYITHLDTRLMALITKFDERTVTITNHLSKIDNVLKDLTTSAHAIGHLEDTVADHEGRIRKAEACIHHRRKEDPQF